MAEEFKPSTGKLPPPYTAEVIVDLAEFRSSYEQDRTGISFACDMHDAASQIVQICTTMTDFEGPRLENFMPFRTYDGVLVERFSFETKHGLMSETTRAIDDHVELQGLDYINSPFSDLKVFQNGKERRGRKGASRKNIPGKTRMLFYRPAGTMPEVKIWFYDEDFCAMLETYDESPPTYYNLFSMHKRGREYYDLPDFQELRQNHPELIRETVATMRAAQQAVIEPMQLAVSAREAATRRSATLRDYDPHERRIGTFARLMDRLVEHRFGGESSSTPEA